MGSPKKEVRCVETGTVFESLVAAARWAGIKSSRVTTTARYKPPNGNWSYGPKGEYRGGDRIGAAARVGGKAAGFRWVFTDDAVPTEKKVEPLDWSAGYSAPVIPVNDVRYSSGRSRMGSDHLRKWVVLSKASDGRVQCCVDQKWYPAMVVQVAHIRPFKECVEEDRYHRDSSLPMSMAMHKLYDFHKFTILADGTISVLDKDIWDELTKLDGQAVLGWRVENSRFVRDNQVYDNAA